VFFSVFSSATPRVRTLKKWNELVQNEILYKLKCHLGSDIVVAAGKSGNCRLAAAGNPWQVKNRVRKTRVTDSFCQTIFLRNSYSDAIYASMCEQKVELLLK
jgi:hypothetical protein